MTLIFNKAQHQPDPTTLHVNTADWTGWLKLTSCWKPTLGKGENNPCFSAQQPRRRPERITSCSSGSPGMPPGTQREQICHCQTIPAFCPPRCAFVYFHHVCAERSGSYELQKAGVITASYITAGNLRKGCLLALSSAAARVPQLCSRDPFTD